VHKGRNIIERLDPSLHAGVKKCCVRLGTARPPSSTNAIESLMAVLRQVCCNVKRWRDARMALRWTATAILEAEKGFRRLKAHKQLPILRTALQRHQQTLFGDQSVVRKNLAA
jgi:hypothetical protein